MYLFEINIRVKHILPVFQGILVKFLIHNNAVYSFFSPLLTKNSRCPVGSVRLSFRGLIPLAWIYNTEREYIFSFGRHLRSKNIPDKKILSKKSLSKTVKKLSKKMPKEMSANQIVSKKLSEKLF